MKSNKKLSLFARFNQFLGLALLALSLSNCGVGGGGGGGGNGPQLHWFFASVGNIGTNAVASSVAIDSEGNSLVAGHFIGDVDFGGPISMQNEAIFLVKLDSHGQYLWHLSSLAFSGSSLPTVSVDGENNIILAGTFSSSIDLGGGVINSAGDQDIFVAKFAPDGTLVWSDTFGDTNKQELLSIVTDHNNDILLTGSFDGTLNFGGMDLVSPLGYTIFIAKLDANGGHKWSKSAGDNSGIGTSIAVDTQNNIVVTGTFHNTADFGCGALNAAATWDIFLTKLNPDTGDCVWSEAFVGSVPQSNSNVAVDSTQNIVMTGSFQGSTDFAGGSPLPSAGSSGQQDIFVAKFDKDGKHLWSKSFGGQGLQFTRSVAVGINNAIFIAGGFSGGPVDFGTTVGSLTLNNPQDSNMLVVKLSSDGSPLWAKSFSDSDDKITTSNSAYSVAVDAAGHSIVGGEFQGKLDLSSGGLGSVTSANQDMFLIQLVE